MEEVECPVKHKSLAVAGMFLLVLCGCGVQTPHEVSISQSSSVSASTDFEIQSYTIVFDLAGGSSPSMVDSREVTSISASDFFFDVTRDGFNFRGWEYNGNLVFDEFGEQVSNPTLVSSMTFRARWAANAKLTIRKNMDGGEVSSPAEVEYYQYVDIWVRPYQGYEFVGWYSTDSAEGTLIATQETYRFLMWDKDTVIEAHFKLANFHLRLSSNNPDLGQVCDNSKPGLPSNATDILHAYTTPQRIVALTTTSEYRFLGWYEGKTMITPNAAYDFDMPNHDWDLEAKWNRFTITYELNKGTNNPNNPTHYSVEDRIALRNPTRTGYDFQGWYRDGVKVTQIEGSWAEHVTLEARWTNALNQLTVISENPSLGSVSIVSGVGYTDELITVNATPVPGNVFNGWFSSGSLVSRDNPFSFVMPAADYSVSASFITKAKASLTPTPILSADGRSLAFGAYPQSAVFDEATINALDGITSADETGYYPFNGAYYCKKIATPYRDTYIFDDGRTIVSGASYWFKVEPIQWNVLSSADGSLFVTSSALLDSHRYDDNSNNYSDSEIRLWLHSDFLTAAFPFDVSAIKTTTVDNSAASTGMGNQYACEDTQDKVFLLSVKELTTTSYGFSSNRSRECRTTDYARASGVLCEDTSTYKARYWTRSPYYNSSERVRAVYSNGSIDASLSNGVGFSGNAVRPAMNVKIS